MAPPPGPDGRVHRTQRRVRLGDVRPSGRLRLDALARYLQDIAADDVRDAGVGDEVAWVVRRTAVEVARWPRYDDVVDVATWCSGVGAAWAERRSTVAGAGVAMIETASLYVSLDPATMRPVPLTEQFCATYGPTGSTRRVRTRLSLPTPGGSAPPGRRWPLRASDIDLFGHVNNAVAWVAVEEELARIPAPVTVLGAEVEYRAALGADTDPLVTTVVADGAVSIWLSVPDDGPAVSALVRTGTPIETRTGTPPRRR